MADAEMLKDLINSYIRLGGGLPPDVTAIGELCKNIADRDRISLLKHLIRCPDNFTHHKTDFSDCITCIPFAAWRRHTRLIDELVRGLTEDEKFNLLMMNPVGHCHQQISAIEIASRNGSIAWVQETLIKQFL